VTRYVPVLRTKKAEWKALLELTDDVRQIITPCLELLPRELAADSSDDRAHAVRRFAKRIRTSWGPRPILVDISLLSSSVRHETVIQLARAAERYSVSPIVVLSLFEEPPVYAAARQAAAAGILRLALRVDYSELEKDDAADYIDMALDNLDTSPAETHLLTDYGVIDVASPNYEWLAERVPYTPSWREFVLLGGSFLRDLNGLAVGTRAHQRWDWFHWESWARVARHRMRLPGAVLRWPQRRDLSRGRLVRRLRSAGSRADHPGTSDQRPDRRGMPDRRSSALGAALKGCATSPALKAANTSRPGAV